LGLHNIYSALVYYPTDFVSTERIIKAWLE